MDGAVLRRHVLAGLLILCFGALAAPAAAQDKALDQPRAQGVVGERYDGFAVVRDSGAPASIRQLVETINGERRALYRQRASSEGVPASELAKVYAKQIFRSAPPGTWFLMENGAWVQK